MKERPLPEGAEELAAYMLGFKHFYGDRDLSDGENLAFANGWHAALAWVLSEARKAEDQGAVLVLDPMLT